jgi:hypothetical protein
VTLRAAHKQALRAGLWHGNLGGVLPAGFETNYAPRTRFLTREELGRLLRQLSPDRAARVAFAVATGANWRETNAAR